MIPRLMSKDDIYEAVSAVCASLEYAIEPLNAYSKSDDRLHPHWVIEDTAYWKASKFISVIKQEVDRVLKHKIAQMEADADGTANPK